MTYRTVRIGVAYRLGILGSADFLLGGVSRHKNRRLEGFCLLAGYSPVSQRDFALITSKVTTLRVTAATKERKKLGTPNGVPSFFGCGDGICYTVSGVICYFSVVHEK